MRSPALQSNLPSQLPYIQCIGPGIVVPSAMCIYQIFLSQVVRMLLVYRYDVENSAVRLILFQLCMLQLAVKSVQINYQCFIQYCL